MPRITPSRGGLTPEQARARRFLDWLHDFEVGRPDPVTGRLVRRPVAAIAAIAGVSRATAYRGLIAGRRLREAIEAARAEGAAFRLPPGI